MLFGSSTVKYEYHYIAILEENILKIVEQKTRVNLNIWNKVQNLVCHSALTKTAKISFINVRKH
jgi:hypothetical protein